MDIKKMQKKIIKVVAVIMAVIGMLLLAVGILLSSLVTGAVGGAMLVAAPLAYKSGTAYIEEKKES